MERRRQSYSVACEWLRTHCGSAGLTAINMMNTTAGFSTTDADKFMNESLLHDACHGTLQQRSITGTWLDYVSNALVAHAVTVSTNLCRKFIRLDGAHLSDFTSPTSFTPFCECVANRIQHSAAVSALSYKTYHQLDRLVEEYQSRIMAFGRAVFEDGIISMNGADMDMAMGFPPGAKVYGSVY
jgi:hypothetical protein